MLDMAIRAPDSDKAALFSLAAAQADTRLEDIIDKVKGRDRWFTFGRAEEIKSVFLRITDNIGFVGNQTREDFVSAIGDAENVELFIDSSGGDSDLALKLADLLMARNTTATITGRCCSAAVPIFLAASRRLIHPQGRMMLHFPSAHTIGGIERHSMAIRSLEKLNARLIDFISARTGQTPEIVAGWFTGKDHWFTASEAIATGLAHEEICAGSLLSRASLPSPSIDRDGGDFPDERMLLDLLTAINRVRVKNKDVMGQKLYDWFIKNVHSHPIMG